MADIATKHDISTAQVCLAWAVAHDIIPIPNATEPHITENLNATTLQLDAEDLAALDAIEDRRRVIDPDSAPWNRD